MRRDWVSYENILLSQVDDDAEIINQYTMYKMLGRGAFGVVRLAIDNETNQRYVLKRAKEHR